MTKKSYMVGATLTASALLCLGIWMALSVSVVNAEPEDYDANANGIFEKNEVLAVIIDYFRGNVTKDEVLEILGLYFLGDTSPEPDPTPTPTPTATPVQQGGDVTAPELVGITLDPLRVDVSDGDGVVRVTVHARDDLSGIDRVQLDFISPSGIQSTSMVESWSPNSGSPTDGVHVGTMTLPRFSEWGVWHLEDAYIHDNVGNYRHYRSGELADLGLSASFETGRYPRSVPSGLRPRSEWTVENPATLQELEAEIERYRGASFHFTSWGGAYQVAQRQAYLIPFQERFGIRVIEKSPMDYDRIAAMVHSNNFVWHVMDVSGLEMWNQSALGNLEELDMSVVDNRDHVETVRTQYGGGGGVTWSTVLGNL